MLAIRRRVRSAVVLAGLALVPLAMAAPTMRATCVDHPTAGEARPHYVGSRPPLLASPFLKLPIGAIRPGGWLLTQLELTRDGYTGHLQEISPYLRREGNAWLDPEGEGGHGWEEVPYWLKGFGDLGYVLGDERITTDAQFWVEAILASRADDGWFGPVSNRTSLDGCPDLWPNMIALNCLQSYYEWSGDERVIDLMDAYFRWELEFPEEKFLVGYWPNVRQGDNLESVYWLYNRTGAAWLLDLAAKIHRCGAAWKDGVANWHGVNIAQGFREPGEYYIQSHDPADLEQAEANYQEVRRLYGQVPGGMYGSDENCRPGYDDPRQGTETCSFVEMMHSWQMLYAMTGDGRFADRCEEIAFNGFPASQTADMRGLHYLTSPNQVQLDPGNKAPAIQNGGNMFAYDPYGYRCCQHNVAMGWPYYAEHLWMATPDAGLAAVLYASSEVTARVGAGEGVVVTVRETTGYPFEETVRLTLQTPEPVEFPLYLRVPGWCRGARVRVAGEAAALEARPGACIRIERLWADGNTVRLELPQELRVTRWPGNHDSASIDLGPLTFSLEIGEQWERYGGTDTWPAMQCLPTTPWNYGLVLGQGPTAGLRVERSEAPLAAQPFSLETAPVRILARGKRIPAWQLLPNLGIVDNLQDSPVRSDEPVEEITLVPMGCARLRVSQFPVIGEGPDATEWVAPSPSRLEASHCLETDSVSAAADGIEPSDSNDTSIPRMTWWPRKGTDEWITYRFDKPTGVSWVEVYWFDDEATGGFCRTPESWQVQYLEGGEWRPVDGAGEYGVAADRYNHVTFLPLTTSQFRIAVKLREGFSSGILEIHIGQ